MTERVPRPSGRKLPIWQHEREILAAIAGHRVVILDGPAGCGKTTQLPQMLQAAGACQGIIGITQPRRIAAISVAERLAAELGVELGTSVGYAIRFDDNTSNATRIKVMTDGILLQETRHNSNLHGYDLIVVDEAHERSLNIDCTLGLLLRAMQRRPDLKVVISSATLRPRELQRFFAPTEPDVPIVAVGHRAHPIDIEYLGAPDGPSLDDLAMAVTDAVHQAFVRQPGGHVLAFLPGEAAIVRCQQHLAADGPANAHVLPLYGRLPQAEQVRVFDEPPSGRKVILATNLAETSITIDGVTAVIDAGKQKLPYFQARTGITALQEQWVSRASANQRAGRAGRTGPGLVLRLYDADDLNDMQEETSPEILRIDLSDAILRLIDLGIQDLEHFELPTAPPRGKVRAALDHLSALGAIDFDRRLTPIGRAMTPFPLSPALARVLVEAVQVHEEALSDVLAVSAMLSIRSPYVTPPGQEELARLKHAQFRRPEGDALSLLQLYRRYEAAPDKAAFCRRNFVDADPLAFAERACHQLSEIATTLGATVVPGPAQPTLVLRCLLAGFVDKLLRRDSYGAETAFGVRCTPHPSSVLFRGRQPFLLAYELVQSGHRTYAFGLSAIEPAWIVEAAPDVARRFQLLGQAGRAASGDAPRRQIAEGSRNEPPRGSRGQAGRPSKKPSTKKLDGRGRRGRRGRR